MDKTQKNDEQLHKALWKTIEKKIKTTMIGAIASIERIFGELWNDGEIDSPEQAKLFEDFQALRNEILDNGNKQLREAKLELDKYNVTRRLYTIQFFDKRYMNDGK